MKNLTTKICLLGLALFVFAACQNTGPKQTQSALIKVDGNQLTYILPSPITDGTVSVEYALANRRSNRQYTDQPLSSEHLAQILWSAYGVTKPETTRPSLRGGFRTAPSAGGRYPFEVYAVVGNVTGIEPGVYRYISEEHKIVRTIDKDIRKEFCEIALGQTFVIDAPVSIFYSAIFTRTTERYGERGSQRYVWIDLGHSAENIYLQAEGLDLGACAIGSFYDDRMTELMQLPEEEKPMYIVTVGHKKVEEAVE